MAQQVNNQNNTLDQQEENQHNTLAQQKENQSFVDFLEQLMPRPLAKFLEDFLGMISYVINICFTLTILHWTSGIEIDTRIYKMGVLGLSTLNFSCCAIFAWVVLNMVSKVF